MPSPPAWKGVNIISFLYLFRLPFMNLHIVCSISLVMIGLGRGRMVAMCVILDSRQAFVMFILAVVVSLVEDQIPISVLMDFMALSQFMLSPKPNGTEQGRLAYSLSNSNYTSVYSLI